MGAEFVQDFDLVAGVRDYGDLADALADDDFSHAGDVGEEIGRRARFVRQADGTATGDDMGRHIDLRAVLAAGFVHHFDGLGECRATQETGGRDRRDGE